MAGDPFGERYHRRAVVGADDQIAFPVTGFEAFLDIGRTVTDGSDVTEWVAFCLFTAAAWLPPPAAARKPPPGASLYTCLCEEGSLLLWLV